MKVRTWMGVVVALGTLAVMGCGVPDPKPTPTPGDPTGSSNTGPFAGIDETEGQMTALTSPCSFVADGGQMTINLMAGEFTVVGGTDAGTLTVNGTACGTATAANTSKITINGSADGGNETVVIDYLNGPFGLGTATSAGIVIDLKGGTGDVVKIRGSNGIDTIGLGTVTAGAGSAGSFAIGVGIGAAPDTNKDITLTNVESVVISTGPGADVVTGAGSVYGAGTSAFGTATSGTAVPVTIYGGDGNDTLTGGAGADTVNGDANDDIINGSAGNDSENGGAGNDTFNEGATANGADVMFGGLGTDTLKYDLRTANLTVSLSHGLTDGEAGENDQVDEFEIVYLGSGNDTLTCYPTGTLQPCTVYGGAGNDTLNGGPGADTLDGQAGDDVIKPGAGNDTVVGGAGTDTVSYADRSAAITVALGAGGAASANNGDPLLTENDSIATVENIIGGSGIDTLTGNDLDNVITGGAGNDILTGGAGNDTFVAGATADGDDTIAGGTGEDTVDYSARSAVLTIVMDGTTASGDLTATEADVIGTDVEDCIGGSAGDTITGNAAANKLDGRGGDDTLNGLAGNDEITGGLGNDTIDSGADDDMVDPGAGTNGVTCGAGFDTLLPTPSGGTTTNVAADCELF